MKTQTEIEQVILKRLNFNLRANLYCLDSVEPRQLLVVDRVINFVSERILARKMPPTIVGLDLPRNRRDLLRLQPIPARNFIDQN